VHLKSLTLKGFKSFASATTLRLEPGITAVVGPNGSGKSNVVDAMAWVLGEQGAKALRGGKMDDVIFAGTADRPPLGRAEVTLTIDNSDGVLPIDYTEVSITRRMFRDGAGEYEINGRSCRLLDIQELLSDSGIGREMHVIVGQGQLDAVLSARPEDRRAFIEEAAGVLKHRKRKEKALRKLDAMQANLTRLTDLTGELRRQLGPLGRQAEVARRAAGVQADLRDARLRLLADDIAAVRADIERDAAAEHEAVEHRASVQRALAAAVARQDRAAAALSASAPAVARAQEIHFALSALAERVRGTVTLAEERSRNLATPVQPSVAGRDPQELDAAAEQAEREQQAKDAAVEAAREELAGTVAARTAAEAALAAAEKDLLAAARAVADRREGLARLAGQVGTARSRLAAGQDELTRLSTAIAEAGERAAAAEAELTELRETIPELDSSEVGLDQIHEQAAAAVSAAEARLEELTENQRRAVARQTTLRARIDALALGLQRKDGAGALLTAGRTRESDTAGRTRESDTAGRTRESDTAGPELEGVLGSVADVIDVSPGAEAAIAAALGAAADGVAVRDVGTAAAAIALLRDRGAGRAGLVVGADPDLIDDHLPPVRRPGLRLPPAAVPALDLVTVRDRLRPAIEMLLGAVVVVDSVDDAAAVVVGYPGLVAATRDGDVLGSAWAAGGSAGGQSAIEIQAAVDEAEDELAAVIAGLGETDAALAGARAELAARQASAEAALAALYESDARLAAVAEQLGRLGEGARLAAAEADRLAERRQAAEAAHRRFRDEVAELEGRLAAAESDPVPDEADPVRRDELAAATSAARQSEVEARLALRTAEERARATAGTAEGLRRAARAERQARERARIAAQRRAAGAALAGRVMQTGARVAARLAEAVGRAASGRASAEAERAAAEQSASEARTAAAALQAEWDALTSSVHSTEVLRAQQTMRRDQLEQAATVDYGVGIDDLLAEFGPDVPVPPSAAEMGEYEAAKERGEPVSAPLPMPYDRPATERRAKRAERDLSLLGKVNPLALEEFAAMEERHAFLAGQLEDLRATRRDLLSVVKEVDERILELFSSAYRDVAREFSVVFATLFPGGEGELVLTDPADMLATGIEVTARPPGKKVKRLSLLSGGERSLVAIAMLVAIFRARPSPFYVLDEVEAALDEVNLMRLVGLLHELRDTSQLIVITHQKYTMEAADVLYGVSMRGDGISQVISQRIRAREDAGPAARDPEFAGAPAPGPRLSGV
jgi:chromosome segregation protein